MKKKADEAAFICSWLVTGRSSLVARCWALVARVQPGLCAVSLLGTRRSHGALAIRQNALVTSPLLPRR